MPYNKRICKRCKTTPEKGGKFYKDNYVNRYKKNIYDYCHTCAKANYECNNCHKVLKCQSFNNNNPNTCKSCVKLLRLQKDKKIQKEVYENPNVVRNIVNSIKFFEINVTEIILEYTGTHTQQCKKCKENLEIKEYKVNKKGNIGKTCIKCLDNKKLERQRKQEEWRNYIRLNGYPDWYDD